MSFESMDPDAALRRMKEDRDLFSSAIGTLVACENFDNRLPAGLMEFLAFFNRHRKAIHAGTVSSADLYAAFVLWLQQGRPD